MSRSSTSACFSSPNRSSIRDANGNNVRPRSPHSSFIARKCSIFCLSVIPREQSSSQKTTAVGKCVLLFFFFLCALFPRQLVLIRAANARRSLYNRDHEQLVGTPSASSDKPLFADDADGRMSAPSSPAKRRPDSIVSSAPDATPISGSSGSRKNVDPTFRHFIKKMAKDEAKHLVTAVRGFIASFKEAQWGPEECGERVQRFYQVNICPPRF